MPVRLAAGKEQDMKPDKTDRASSRQAIANALAAEYRAQEDARRRGDFPLAWHHLERAHILSQTDLMAHIGSHLRMLALAMHLRDWREVAGQIMRLALAPVGNLTRRLPVGNTGRSTVSAFAPMQIPPDLQAILDREDG
jgi:hypothetical protein